MWRYHFRKKERSQNTFKRSSKWQFRSCVDHVQSVRRSSRKGVRLRKQLLQSTQLERSETAMIWLQAAHIWSEQRSNCTNAMIHQDDDDHSRSYLEEDHLVEVSKRSEARRRPPAGAASHRRHAELKFYKNMFRKCSLITIELPNSAELWKSWQSERLISSGQVGIWDFRIRNFPP